MLGGDVQLLTKLSLCFDDLMTFVVVEEDTVSDVLEGAPGRGSSSNNMRGSLIANIGSIDEDDDDDVRLTDEISNFPLQRMSSFSFSRVGQTSWALTWTQVTWVMAWIRASN